VSDWRAITDDREKYKAYLCSREWALLRNAVRDRCGGKCERCQVNDMECVHHLTYARKYLERLEDLAGWCNACHDFTHGKSDEDPVESYMSRQLDNVIDRERFLEWADSAALQGKSWHYLLSALAGGDVIIETMGLLWFTKAIRGEFRPHSQTAEYLEQLVKRKRKEQGMDEHLNNNSPRKATT